MDYAGYLSRKCSIAVALGVLKNKPVGLSTEQYVLQLQNQIKSHTDDFSIDQISISSLDFENIGEAPDECDASKITNSITNSSHQNNYATNCQYKKNHQLENQSQLDENNIDVFPAHIHYDSREYGQRFEECHIPQNIIQSNNTNLLSEQTGDLKNASATQIRTNTYLQKLDDILFSQNQNEQRQKSSENKGLHKSKFLKTCITAKDILGNDTLPTPTPSNLIIHATATEDLDTEICSQIDMSHMRCTQEQNIAGSQVETIKIPNQIEMHTQETSTQTPLHTQEDDCIEMLSQAITDSETSDVRPISIDSEEKGVPFKLIIELDKVKHVLSKIDNVDSKCSQQDSGYRSEGRSSTQSSVVAGLLSDEKLNQSAQTILDHLSSCSGRALAHPVTADASVSLARLVDVLHERRSYPVFLDDLLAKVGDVVEAISSDACSGDAFFKKEDSLHRLSLLTESAEITTYAMDKLLDSLEAFHRRLAGDPEATHELANVEGIENQCYVFHALETLIGKYLSWKSRETDATALGESLDSPTPTPKNLPASIEDMWRTRWDSNYAPQAKEVSHKPRRDIERRCSEVLNKLIVTCMNGYSLISYAALECFNSLQP